MNHWHYSLLVGCLLGVLAQPAQAQEAPKTQPTPLTQKGVAEGRHIGKVEVEKSAQVAPTPIQKQQRKAPIGVSP